MLLPILLIVITLVTGYIKLPKLKLQPFVLKEWLLVILLAISAIISCIVEYNKSLTSIEEGLRNANVGTLDLKDQGSSRIVWFLGNKPLPVYFSSDNINIENVRIQSGNDLFEPFKGIEFIARIENNQIKINTTIRDSLGNVIVKLIDNEWQVTSPQFVLDRNYDDTALEVVDNYGEIVFQIAVSKNKMLMNGIFFSPDGSVSMAFPILANPSTDTRFWISGLVHFERGNLNLLRETKLKSIFRYPSRLHQGERVVGTNKKVENTMTNIPHYPQLIRNPKENYLILY